MNRMMAERLENARPRLVGPHRLDRAKFPTAAAGAYSVSQAGVPMLSRRLAMERVRKDYGDAGIRCSSRRFR